MAIYLISPIQVPSHEGVCCDLVYEELYIVYIPGHEACIGL